MASQSEFRKANEIIHNVKNADGKVIHIFDLLDACHISLSWWKDHKKWLLHRYPQLTIEKRESENYLVYSGKYNESK